MGRKSNDDIVVTKSVCLPLSIINAVAEEQTVMGCSFSETLSRLLLLSLNLRKDRRKEVLEEVRTNAGK
jgi:hypothetical protein